MPDQRRGRRGVRRRTQLAAEARLPAGCLEWPAGRPERYLARHRIRRRHRRPRRREVRLAAVVRASVQRPHRLGERARQHPTGSGAPQRIPRRDRRRRPLRSLGRAQHPARLQPGLQGRGQLGPVLRGFEPAGRAARALPGLARLHAAERALRAQLHAGRQGQFLRMNAMQNITNRRAGWRVLAASTLALALAACGAGQGPADAAGTGTAAQAEDAEDRADRAREAARSDGVTAAAAVPEAFATPMTPGDNIDSVASWTGPDGKVLLLATAKSTHRLVVYDG